MNSHCIARLSVGVLLIGACLPASAFSEDCDLLDLLEHQIVAIWSDPARLLARCEPARLEAALAALATYPLVRAVDDFEKDAAAYDAAHLAVLRALAGLGR